MGGDRREQEGGETFSDGGVNGEVAAVDEYHCDAALLFGPEKIANPYACMERWREGTEGSVKGMAGVCSGENGGTERVEKDREIHEP